MIRRRTRQNQTSRFRWDRWADALPLGFAYADRFTCPRLPVAILRLRHKGCTAMKKALYGIVTQRLTDDLWSTTSHELDPPMGDSFHRYMSDSSGLEQAEQVFFTNQYDCDRRSHGRGARQRQTVMQLQEENGK